MKKIFFLPKIDVHIYIVRFLSKFWGPDAILRSGFGLMDRPMDGRANQHTGRQTDRPTDGPKDGPTDGPTDGQRN